MNENAYPLATTIPVLTRAACGRPGTRGRYRYVARGYRYRGYAGTGYCWPRNRIRYRVPGTPRCREMAAAPRSLSGKRKRKLGGASGGKRRAGQERELAELAQLEAENAALLAAAAPQVDGLRRTAAIAWERTLRATGSDPIERQLRDALRSYAAVLEVLPQDAEATQRQSALCRRLRELAKEAPMQHQKRKHTVAVSASATDSAAAGVPAVTEIKKLTVADIREIAARAKAEMRPSADLGGGTGDGTDAGTGIRAIACFDQCLFLKKVCVHHH
eukprot:COSAG02_NODE_16637_length_1068_cov_0.990712_1_plen_274_part_00